MAAIIGDPIIAVTNGTVDSQLDNLSENPVQNKVVNAAINDVADNLFTVASTQPSSDTNVLWLDTGNDVVELAEMSDLEDIVGDLDDLTTTAKSNLVAAINEAAQSGGSGSVSDVQINGTSILSSGVANIPFGTHSGTLGVISAGVTYGTSITNTGQLRISKAASSEIKASSGDYKPIVPSTQREAVFYGLAKAAGDTTQGNSPNAVGTYTDEAKAAIKSMLGVSDGDLIVVTVTGTTPSITAAAGHRYKCGEVTELSFTPSATGICDVIFTSGTTATILTVPNTVKWPDGFDPTSLEASTTYELNVVDGTLGGVIKWQ